MDAIETKYFGPSNTKGSRIKATTASGQSVTLPWDYSLDTEPNHARVAKALAEKLGWGDYFTLHGGYTKRGYTFVAVPRLKEPGV